jgi:hypothetical protein
MTKSSRKGKKWMVKPLGIGGINRTIHFGAESSSDFTIHHYEDRKERYIKRHQKRENWNDSTTAGFWARWMLWEKPSIAEAIANIKRRFGIRVIY